MKKLFLLLLICNVSFGAAIAQWKMNENADDDTVADSVGTHTGTFIDENALLRGTYTSDHNAVGQLNGGLIFDGTNDYIEIADHDDFSPILTPFSVAAWISLSADQGAANFMIVNKADGASAALEWRFAVSNDALIFSLYDQDAGGTTIGRSSATDYDDYEGSGFIFVVATYDGGTSSSGIKLYLDAIQDDDNDENNGTFSNVVNNDEIVRIGIYDISLAKGEMDNVVIYDEELTQAQITTLYADGVGTEAISSTTVGASSLDISPRPFVTDFRRDRLNF